jgi:aspartyl-tRNA(Asn)/glutamyl-tRNA(Gln) amidotransferase subunit A
MLSADDLPLLSLSEASELVQKQTISPVELTQACLARIERLNPQLNAFITVSAELAMKQARQAEAEIGGGEWKGPLHGIPLALKDLLETRGVRTTAGSAVFSDFIPDRDAFIVERLKAAGAVLLGKLNLHEFAYGASAVISYFGPVRNPWDRTRITGGSSSGSAAAVSASLCYGAIGTDTAGSIRLPASFCGIVGLKPTYGLVSLRGVIPLSWSYDHAGPMARSTKDAALLLQVIASYDAEDLYAQKFPAVYYPAAMEESHVPSLRLGVPREFFWQDLHPEVESVAQEALAVLTRLTAGAADVQIEPVVDRTVSRCEPFVYHQRFVAEHSDRYDPETLRRIRSGAEVSAAEYIEKHQELLRLRREINSVFEKVDLLVTPTCVTLPPSIAELQSAPEQLRAKELLMLRNTRPFNVYGLPSISVPCGYSQAGLPIGLQITAAPGNEAMVLAAAYAFEQENSWHERRPEV